MVAHWLNRNPIFFKLVIHGFCLSVCAIFSYKTFKLDLGENPFETIMTCTGIASWGMLVLTLVITPLRRILSNLCKALTLSYGKRLSDWNFLIKSRRLIGLWAAFFGLLHFVVYCYLEFDFEWLDIWQEIVIKPYLTVGCFGLAIYFVLSVTSPRGIQKKCGRLWRPIHRSVYILALLVIAHVYLQQKILTSDYFFGYLLTLLLLLYRLMVLAFPRFYRKDDDGLEKYR